MRFKPGQEVVCVTKEHEWRCHPGSEGMPHPKYNETCVIDHYCGGIAPDGNLLVHIVGYESCFTETCFEPLVNDAVLAEELETIVQYEEMI
jgi:hypothetical protein